MNNNSRGGSHAVVKVRYFVLTWLALWPLAALGQAEDWWQFRGSNGGHSTAQGVPLEWDSFFHEPKWKTQIPGKGWSSPIVIGDRIWLTSAEQLALENNSVANKLDELPAGAYDLVTDASVKLFAVELDAQSGELLRRIDLFERQDPQPIHAMNSYASPTPVSDGERIYCHFGALGTACIDIHSGQVLWQRALVVDEITGPAASPVLWEQHLILACDGADQQYLISLDKMTGETLWKVERPEIAVVDDTWRRAFSTPLIVESTDRVQLISMSAQWLTSINPADGSPWWRAKVGSGYSAVPTPVCTGERVVVCTGFPKPEMVAVDINGSGDVTDSGIAWRYARQVPEISSPLVVDGDIYFASTQGVVSCLEAATGSLHWQARVGGKFAASPILVGERIYFTNSAGVTTVIRPGHVFQELASNELFGETYASLVVYKDKFLLRTNPYLFCLEATP